VTALEAEQAQLRARQERLVLRTTNKVPVHNIDVTGLTVRERDTYLCRIALEAEIATLEAALSDSTRQILGAKG
jgi:hypothetical protein